MLLVNSYLVVSLNLAIARTLNLFSCLGCQLLPLKLQIPYLISRQINNKYNIYNNLLNLSLGVLSHHSVST